jgi:uncharacterized protein (TIGR02996 family)
MTDDHAFLDALKANPADDTTRLVYADWLDEHGESAKAEYLRLAVRAIHRAGEENQPERDTDRALALAEQVPLDWRAAVAARFTVVLAGYELPERITIIKIIRQLMGLGLKEAKDFVEALPARLPLATTIENALEFRKSLCTSPTTQAAIRPCEIREGPRLVLYGLYAELVPTDWENEAELPTEAFDQFAAFLSVAMGITHEQATGVAREVPEVQLAENLELHRLEQRRAEVRACLPTREPQQGWLIDIYSVPKLVNP